MEALDYQKMRERAFGPWEPGYEGKTLSQWKEEDFNSKRGELEGYDCPKCLNRGFFMRFPEDASPYAVECSCMKMRRSLQRLKRSGLARSVMECTFERFRVDQPWQQAALDQARSYARNPVGWFLAAGQSGSGKTHLCSAICRELLLHEREVRYLAWREQIEGLKDLSQGGKAREQELDGWRKAEVLYIDDLFKGGTGYGGRVRPTAMDVSVAFQLLNYRYANRLPTIVSTELLPDELIALDEATGSRILERAEENMVVIRRDRGRNYRLRGRG